MGAEDGRCPCGILVFGKTHEDRNHSLAISPFGVLSQATLSPYDIPKLSTPTTIDNPQGGWRMALEVLAS